MAFSALGSDATLYLVSNVDIVQSSKVQAFPYRVPILLSTISEMPAFCSRHGRIMLSPVPSFPPPGVDGTFPSV